MPPLSAPLCALAGAHLLLSALAYGSARFAGAVMFVPANTCLVHVYLWNVLTYPLADDAPASALLNAAFLVAAGDIARRKLGWRALAALLAFVQLGTAAMLFWIHLLLFVVTRNEAVLFVRFCGLGVYSAAFAVFAKLALAERRLFTSIALLKFRHLPWLMLVLTAAIAWMQPAASQASYLLPNTLATYFSWVYLRFIRVHSESGVLGDVSDEFALASFFPPFCRRFVDWLGDVCLRIFVVVGLCKKYAVQNRLYLGDGVANVSPPLSPVPMLAPAAALDDDEAAAAAAVSSNRRRMLAMQAIDEQIAKQQQQQRQQQKHESDAAAADRVSLL